MAAPCTNQCPSGYLPANCIDTAVGCSTCASGQVCWGCQCVKDNVPLANTYIWCDCPPVSPSPPPSCDDLTCHLSCGGVCQGTCCVGAGCPSCSSGIGSAASSGTVYLALGLVGAAAVALVLRDRSRGRSSISHFPNLRSSAA